MDAIQVIAPLIGVVLGGALSGVGAHIRARRERKRIIATALADLLEVRHRIVAFNLVVAKIRALAGIKIEALPELRNLFDAIAPVDPGLDERYSQAVTLLSGIDPVLAFSLRSKHAFPKVLATLRNKAAASGADLGMFEAFESQLLAAAKPTLDSAVLELGRSHSFLTSRKVKRIVRRSDEIPADVSEFFDRLASIDPGMPTRGQNAT